MLDQYEQTEVGELMGFHKSNGIYWGGESFKERLSVVVERDLSKD